MTPDTKRQLIAPGVLGTAGLFVAGPLGVVAGAGLGWIANKTGVSKWVASLFVSGVK